MFQGRRNGQAKLNHEDDVIKCVGGRQHEYFEILFLPLI